MEIRTRRVRITLFYLILLCLFIGIISTYVYTRISREISGSGGGMFDFTVLAGGGEESIRGIRVAVVRSEQTADYLVWVAENRKLVDGEGENVQVSGEETRENYYAMSEFWMDQMDQNNMAAELISEDQLLDNEEMDDFNLLVLPAVYCLSDDQINAIKSFLTQRKSVVMTHFGGNRFEDGGDRPWSLITDIVGAEWSHPSNDHLKNNATELIFIRDNPITADIAPGLALPITTFDRPVAANIRDHVRAFPAAVWPDAADFLPMDPSERAAVVHGTYRGGRFVWFGFTAQSVEPGPRNWPYFQKLISNAFQWAGRQPTTGRSAWPRGATMAATIGVIAPENFYETSGTEAYLRENNLPYAVFVDNADSQMMPSASVRERDRIEVGLHGELDFNAELLDDEISDINQAREEIEKDWDIDIDGFAMSSLSERLYEPSENLDFEYLWISDQRLFTPQQIPFGRGLKRPFFSRTPAPLLAMGQSSRGDQDLIEGYRLTDADSLAEGMVRDLERVFAVGGLYSVTFESTIMDELVNEPEIERWLDAYRSGGIWRASPREIAEWWKRYESITLQIRQEGSRFTMRVTNEGNEEVDEAVVYIYPSVLPEALEIRSERMRTPIPNYRIRSELNRIELILTDMSPRENRTYYLEY